MTNSIIKILLIGNYSIFRTALRMLIETEEKLKVVGETSDLSQISAIITQEKPGVILIDMPDEEKDDIFLFLQQAVLNIPVLILSGCPNSNIYKKCMHSGISGLVLKEKSADTLFKAIEKVHQGELWFERIMMGEIIKELVNEKSSPEKNSKTEITRTFTERENQILDLICQGLKNKAIAEKLFITETTVRHHLTSLFNKLEISTRLELVVYAFRNNLVKPPDENNKPDSKNEPFSGSGNGHKSELKEIQKRVYIT